MLFDDLTIAGNPGWSELMRLARSFPLESFRAPRPTGVAATLPLEPQRPTRVSYEAVHQLVDGEGDGPSIGLGL